MFGPVGTIVQYQRAGFPTLHQKRRLSIASLFIMQFKSPMY